MYSSVISQSVLPKHDALSVTPRFSEVETCQRRKSNRFNGFAAGKTVETVGSLLRPPVTALKRGVNESEIVVGQHALTSAALRGILSLLVFCLMVLFPNHVAAQSTLQYHFDNISLSIPDANPAGCFDSRSITSGLSGAVILDVKVSLDIGGPGSFNGDLYVALQHDNHSSVLLNRVGRTEDNPDGYGDSGMNITLDDAATDGNVHEYRLALFGDNEQSLLGDALTGQWISDGRASDPDQVLETSTRTLSLSSFNGMPVDGTWRLYLADLSSGGVSVLNSWGLDLVVSTVPNPPLSFKDATLRSDGGPRLMTNEVTISGQTTFEAVTPFSLQGTVMGDGSVMKTGPGDFILSGTNQYTGGTTVQAGRLVINNSQSSPTGSGLVTIGQTAVLGGTGILGGDLILNGTLAPGQGVGSLITRNQMWNGGARYTWEIKNPIGQAGVDWDWVNVNGSLTIQASTDNRCVLEIAPLASSMLFSTTNYAWTILSTTGGIAGFDTNSFTLLVDRATNSIMSNQFALVLTNSGKDLQLVFSPATVDLTIQTQPVSQVKNAGETTSLTVVATGGALLAYQWKKNGLALADGGNVSGAKSPTLTITNLLRADQGAYSVTVSDSLGSIDSTAANLTLIDPVIVQQPNSTTNNAGSTIIFSVKANGTAPLAYQWKKNGVNLANGARISGAKTTTLTIKNVVGADVGTFSVTVTGVGNPVTSAAAKLAVIDPVITRQPDDSTNNFGTTATFRATAAGTAPLGYQWNKNGVALVNGGNVSGATSATLTLKNVAFGDHGIYALTVTGKSNSISSTSARLVVNDPLITKPPAGSTKNAGTTVSFSVTATGTAPLKYQWLKNGASLANGGHVSGATAPTLTLTNVLRADAGAYSVTVSGAGAPVTSAIATLSIVDPIITKQPANAKVKAGGSAAFTVRALGTSPLSYQWMKNGVPLADTDKISGARSSTLSLTSVLFADTGAYSVTISGAGAAVQSSAAALTVTDPIITKQPANVKVKAGAIATFSITAFGTEPLKYQWLKDGISLTNSGNVSGVTSPTLTITNALHADEGVYSATVSGAGGPVTSSQATLTVTEPVIIQQPAKLKVAPGATATFSVIALGTPPLMFQWRKSGTNIAFATNSTFTIARAATTDAGPYTVVVSNAFGNLTSSQASLTLTRPPEMPPGPAHTGPTQPAQIMAIQLRPDGTRLIKFQGAPGQTYSVEASMNSISHGWRTLVTTTAGPDGQFEHLDFENAELRFYRAVAD